MTHYSDSYKDNVDLIPTCTYEIYGIYNNFFGLNKNLMTESVTSEVF